jgi:large subunit ribosomal protein L35Ae
MVNILSQKIFGRITNYRKGPKAQYTKECLVELETITSDSLAGKLVGQKILYKDEFKNLFNGKIVGAHGGNGMVKVKFARPVPGQAIGGIVELVG